MAIGLIAIGLFFVWLNQTRLERLTSDDFTPVEATITGFTTTDNDGGLPPRVLVSAVSPDGTAGLAKTSPQRLQGCKVGDKIRAEKRGLDLRLLPSACKQSD